MILIYFRVITGIEKTVSFETIFMSKKTRCNWDLKPGPPKLQNFELYTKEVMGLDFFDIIPNSLVPLVNREVEEN